MERIKRQSFLRTALLIALLGLPMMAAAESQYASPWTKPAKRAQAAFNWNQVYYGIGRIPGYSFLLYFGEPGYDDPGCTSRNCVLSKGGYSSGSDNSYAWPNPFYRIP